MDNEILLEPPAPEPPDTPTVDPATDLTEGPPAPAPGHAGWRGWAAGAAATAVVVGVGAFFIGKSSSDSTGTPSDAVAAVDANTAYENAFGGPGGRGTAGMIKAINGGTLTVESAMSSATVSVVTDRETRFTESFDGSLADLAVGDTVTVIGETTDESLTALSIVENDGTDEGGAFFMGASPDRAVPADGAVTRTVRPVRGTITSVDGSTLTVRADDGTQTTVDAAGATVSVTRMIGFADLAVGDTVRVNGTDEGAAVRATLVHKGALPMGGPGQFRNGSAVTTSPSTA